MVSAREAVRRLKAGNRRFVAGEMELARRAGRARREALVAGQAPFAAVLGCADSRVPVELVFDQGPGDLFVVRVAGSVAGPSEVGSLQYAVRHLGTRLVVVLGHSGCGAFVATLEAAQRPTGKVPPDLLSVLERIRPALEPLLTAAPPQAARAADHAAAVEQAAGATAAAHATGANDLTGAALVAAAVRANTMAVTARLRQLLCAPSAGVAGDEDLQVIGAEYCLSSGVVTFLDEAGTTG
jgi:carbonic anhydrase